MTGTQRNISCSDGICQIDCVNASWNAQLNYCTRQMRRGAATRVLPQNTLSLLQTFWGLGRRKLLYFTVVSSALEPGCGAKESYFIVEPAASYGVEALNLCNIFFLSHSTILPAHRAYLSITGI